MMLSWQTLALSAVILAMLLLAQTFEHRRFVLSRRRKPIELAARPRAAVIAPCKGLDVGLEENLLPLFAQDYGNFELLFVVEQAGDPAREVIEQLIRRHPRIPARCVVAGSARDSGQKVHNLIAAIQTLDPDVEILAFVDSDARPQPAWLGRLVSRLLRPGVGAVTGYRWFIPQRDTPANWALYAINGAAATLFSPGGHHLVWGGSWVIRRRIAEQIGLVERWHGTLSDDLVATRLLHKAALRVDFEPHCVTPSPLDNSWAQTLEFLRRQYVMGRFYLPRLWAATLAWMTVTHLGWIAALNALLLDAEARPLAGGYCLAMLAMGAGRAWLRRDLARTYVPQHWRHVRRAAAADMLAGPLFSLINWLGMLSSLWGSRVTWRAITYRLRWGGRVELLSGDPSARAPCEPPSATVRPPKFAQSPPTTARQPRRVG